MKSGKLKLVKLVVDNEDIKYAANHSPKALDNLKSYGNDARIANQIFVVMEASITKTFTSATSFNITVNQGLVKVSAEGSSGGSGATTVTVSEGSCFAYGLVKLDWDKGKHQLDKVTDDQWSFN
jgi:hypothetical protein